MDMVAACLASGRRAVVLVPSSEPLPATAAAVHEAFGDRAANFVGGDPRGRYRTWLDVLGGRFDVVVAEQRVHHRFEEVPPGGRPQRGAHGP